MSKNWQSYSAITALLAAGADDLLLRDKSDTTDHATEGTVGRLPWEGLLGLSGITPGGRLTTESGVPVSTSDRTAQGTIYYTPDAHDFVRLWDGTRPKIYQFTERSLAITATSGKNYDYFLYDNSGTLTLEPSAAWTNDTTRADALAWQAGIGWVKSGTPTRLHLGTIRASAANVTESSWNTTDAPARSFVWNRYNRRFREAIVRDSTDSWNYTTATIRQKRASANNQVEFVCGDVTKWAAIDFAMSGNASAASYNSVGIDSTTTMAGNSGYRNGVAGQGVGKGSGVVAAGYHYIAALERSDAAGTTTWYGDGSVPSYFQSALFARIFY